MRQGISPSPHRLKAQWEKPPCGAEPRIELGPAVQQADALPTEPRRSNSNYDSKMLDFVLLFFLFLRGVRFPPHKKGPGFESRPGTLRGILQ